MSPRLAPSSKKSKRSRTNSFQICEQVNKIIQESTDHCTVLVHEIAKVRKEIDQFKEINLARNTNKPNRFAQSMTKASDMRGGR